MPEDAMITAARKIDALEREVRRLRTIQVGHTIADVCGLVGNLPALRGFWSFASRSETGAPIDQSGQGRHLTPSGGVTYSFMDNGISYAQFNGSSGYLTRADEAGLDITDTLTLGGWFWVNALSAIQTPMAKDGTPGQRSYLLRVNATSGVAQFSVFGNGTTTVSAAGGAVGSGAWFFLVGRYRPGAELAVFLNGAKTVVSAGVPAAIYSGTMPLQVGAANAANFLGGRAALCFLCASALSDKLIDRIFDVTRPFFGV